MEEDTGIEYTYDPVMQDWKKKVAPYSAIVCKDGSTVWAEDSDGKTIASGEAGVDDASVIQSALDLRGTIIIKGNFIIDTSLLPKSDSTIIMYNAIIKSKDEAFRVFNLHFTDGVSNIRVYGGELDGNGANVNVGQCIRIDNYSQNIYLYDMYVHDGNRANLLIHTAKHIRVHNCRFETSHDTTNAMVVPGTEYAEDVLLDGCYIKETLAFHAVGINYACKEITLRKCIIEAPNGDGVWSESYSDQPVEDVTIEDCTIKNCKSFAISTEANAPKGWKIINNIIRDCGGAAIRIRGVDNLIQGNTIENTGYTAYDGTVYLNGDIGTRVIGNIIRNATTAGIRSWGGSHHKIIGNRIYNCSKSGILLIEGGEHSKLIGNEIYNNGEYGVYVKRENVLIEGNVIYNNSQSSSNTYDGIYIRALKTKVINNNLYDDQDSPTQRYHIYVYWGDSEIVGNTFGAAASGAYSVRGDSPVKPALIKFNIGYTTENSGTATFDGDGTTTDFSIGAHGLAVTDPSRIVVKVSPVSADAIAASPCVGYVDPADNTKIRVKFASAPASGSGNVKIVWEAQVVS